jgi:hypothetical protein
VGLAGPDGRRWWLVHVGADLSRPGARRSCKPPPNTNGAHQAFLDPAWRTLDLPANTEAVIHRTIHLRDPKATPPELRARRVSVDELDINMPRHGGCARWPPAFAAAWLPTTEIRSRSSSLTVWRRAPGLPDRRQTPRRRPTEGRTSDAAAFGGRMTDSAASISSGSECLAMRSARHSRVHCETSGAAPQWWVYTLSALGSSGPICR